MDDLRRWTGDGGYHARGCDVPALATDYADGGVVYQCGRFGVDWVVVCDCDREVDILHHHCGGGESWDLDIPEVVRRRWICSYYLSLSTVSFTPLRLH